MGKLLALDLSTSCTGHALFDLETKELIAWGVIRPTKTFRGLPYPKQQLYRLQDMANEVSKHIESVSEGLERIAVEEINRGLSRLGQKTLDGFHFILLDRIEDRIDLIYYKDSDGKTGWRTELKLVLTELDKKVNAQRRALNSKLGKNQKKQPIINKKHLACAFANKHYGHRLDRPLDFDLNKEHGDIADAILLGHAILAGI